MSYTITSAQWANAANTAVMLQTVEAGAVVASPERPEPWQAFLDWDAVPGNDPAAFDPLTPAELTQLLRDEAKATVDTFKSSLAKALRGLVAVLVDEINTIRQWITDFKGDVAAATSLANLQTRVAANPDLPDRTLAQAKAAILNKIDGGAVD